MELKLSDQLDLDALAKEYAKNRRGQVRGLFTPESAERIFQCLENETPWGMVYNHGEKVIQVPNEKVRTMTPQERQAITQEVYMRAQSEYQYLYYYYPILDSYKSGKNPDFFLHRVLEFMNSEPMLEFIRKLTGIPEIIKADGQATLYQGNCFLHRHLDVHSDQGWRCAYVMNFTKEWFPSWGGMLQFYDEDFNVEEAFIPIFNAINVFTVPKFHSVSYVPPFSGGDRLSITGWFRDK